MKMVNMAKGVRSKYGKGWHGESYKHSLAARGYLSKKWNPPSSAKVNAINALRIRSKLPKSKQAGTLVGLRRARQFESGKPLTFDTTKRVASFVRHLPEYERAKSKGKNDSTSKAIQAVNLWGGKEAILDARRHVRSNT